MTAAARRPFRRSLRAAMGLLLLSATAAAVGAARRSGEMDMRRTPGREREEPGSVDVMTLNMYAGTDVEGLLEMLLTPDTSLLDVLSMSAATIQAAAATNITERTVEMAAKILERRPHFVALQEVFQISYILSGSQEQLYGPLPFRSYLNDLMDELDRGSSARGGRSPYVFVASTEGTALSLPAVPIDGLGMVTAVAFDNDAIFVRSDIADTVTNVDFQCNDPSFNGCRFDAGIAGEFINFPFKLLRTYQGVDATVNGKKVRLINTHLEVRNPSPSIQYAQMRELLERIDAVDTDGIDQTIIAGDINSSPVDADTVFNGATLATPYNQLLNAGYVDAWALAEPDVDGFTCCQDADLLNEDSAHHERVDVIFTSNPNAQADDAELMFSSAGEKTPSGLWPTDHAALAIELRLADASPPPSPGAQSAGPPPPPSPPVRAPDSTPMLDSERAGAAPSPGSAAVRVGIGAGLWSVMLMGASWLLAAYL